MLTELIENQEALSSFFYKHFSAGSSTHFAAQFLGPVEDTYEEEYEAEEDDGLGHYSDGVKRTLTDEQIAMFRHSEIESLLRERRHIEEAKDHESVSEARPSPSISNLEDGELEDEVPVVKTKAPEVPKSTAPPAKKFGKALSKKQRKAQLAKERGFFKQNVKPDLRKRTWDKVDAGMDSLAYDDEPSSASGPSQAPQRRRISYDDD